MRFKVWSKRATESKGLVAANCHEPHIWISIYGNEVWEKPAELPANEHRKAELFLQFDDVTAPAHARTPMNEEQAKQIVGFVDEWKDKVSLICVNCEAGISRSAATAAALSLWLNGNHSGIVEGNGFFPNSHVQKGILNAIEEHTK